MPEQSPSPLAERPAPILRRLAAYALDCTVLLGGLLVLQAILYPVNPIVAMMRDGVQITGRQLHLWVFATATVPFVIYFATWTASRRQATPGMHWLGLRVALATDDRGRISLPRAVLRSTVLLLPFELNHAVMFHLTPPSGTEPTAALWIGIAVVWFVIAMYVVTMVVTRRRQSLHDIAAGTVVARLQSR